MKRYNLHVWINGKWCFMCYVKVRTKSRYVFNTNMMFPILFPVGSKSRKLLNSTINGLKHTNISEKIKSYPSNNQYGVEYEIKITSMNDE